MTTAEIQQYIQTNTPDPAIALAQAAAESSFNPNAVSGAGAKGLWQFMPGTWAQYGGGGDIFDVVASTAARNSYMADLLGMFGGDYAKALAAYNWGGSRVQKAVAQFGADWLSHAPVETRGYVQRILGNQVNFFRALLKTKRAPTTGNPPKETKS